MHLRYFPATVIALVLLSAVYAHAQTYESVQTVLDIGADGTVHYTAAFSFASPVAGNVSYSLSEMPQNVKISDGKQQLDYRVITGEAYRLDIMLNDPADRIAIEYDVKNAVFESGQIKHFFTEYSFENPVNMNVVMKLPPGYGIHMNSYDPDGAQITSDGQRIGLAWNLENVTTTLFFVNYSSPLLESNLPSIAAVILVGAIVVMLYYFRRRSMEAFLSGFREHEKKTIEYLSRRKIALQSDIQKEFTFSRAKTTRIISTLEGKGLVKKRRYGRTNKLYWVKPAFIRKNKELKKEGKEDEKK